MTKYDVVLSYSRKNYEQAIKRREQIRGRVNLVSLFGLTLTTFLGAEIITLYKNQRNTIRDWHKLILFLLLEAIIVFFIAYIKSIGVGNIDNYNPIDTRLKGSDIIKISNDYKSKYLKLKEKLNYDGTINHKVLAETGVTKLYYAELYDDLAIGINVANKKLSKFFSIMIYSLVITIILEIVLIGGVLL